MEYVQYIVCQNTKKIILPEGILRRSQHHTKSTASNEENSNRNQYKREEEAPEKLEHSRHPRIYNRGII